MSQLININIVNHPPIVISDFIDALTHEIDSLGINKYVSFHCVRGAKNIIIENFTEELNRSIKKNFSLADPDLVLVMTEIVRGEVLDSTSPGPGEDTTGWYNKNSEKWLYRSKMFFDIVAYFGTVICVSEEIYESIIQLNLKSKIIYWKPKYHGPTTDINLFWRAKADNRKFTQLVFSGSETGYRIEQLDNLRNNGLSIATCRPHTPENVRSILHAQSLLAFGPLHYRSTKQLSKMRVMWSLDNFFPIIMQRCPLETDLDKYCVFYDDEEHLIEMVSNYESTFNECLSKNLEYVNDTASQMTSLNEIFD